MDILMGEEGTGAANRDGSKCPRPFVGMHFKCCNVYLRIYRNKAQDAYEGACPKCFRKVKLPIGAGGTNNRFFEAN